MAAKRIETDTKLKNKKTVIEIDVIVRSNPE